MSQELTKLKVELFKKQKKCLHQVYAWETKQEYWVCMLCFENITEIIKRVHYKEAYSFEELGTRRRRNT
jgi:hypothetical protein